MKRYNTSQQKQLDDMEDEDPRIHEEMHALKKKFQEDMNPGFGSYILDKMPVIGKAREADRNNRFQKLQKMMGKKYE